MRKSITFLALLALIVVFAIYKTAHTQAQGQGQGGPPEVIIHRVNPHNVGEALTPGSTAALSPITNHGGPVMPNTINIYYIWYGDWNQANSTDTPAGQQILRDFANNIGGSDHFAINKTYGVSGAVTFKGETTDTGTSKRLTDANIKTIVSNAISSGRLLSDPNGVYFVLTSSNVTASSGFCTKYCGWHTWGTISGFNIKYSFVGNAARCISACAAQSVGPNGNAGVDGMVSVLAHELEEAASDPNLNAWYDSSGAENADKCAWTFGSRQTQLPSGAWYNVTLGTRNYLIQRNLKTDNKCYIDGVNNIQ
ncbi:MAG: hypothetical protein U0Y68_01320 [Blastocatellia bacterium]